MTPSSEPMKALTIHQPWASLIALGVKTIETRSWSTKYRGRIAIHAGQARPDRFVVFDQWGKADVRVAHGDNRCRIVRWKGNSVDRVALPLGAVVATADLVDVVPMVQFLSRGPGHNPQPLYLPDRYDAQHGGVPFPMLAINNDASLLTLHHGHGTGRLDDFTDQLPFGDFTPGRFAWLLDNIEPIDPVPAKGRQGLWNWIGDTDDTK